MNISSLPYKIQAQLNTIAIHTGYSIEEIYCLAIKTGLNVVEDIVTQQYTFMKIDERGNLFDLEGGPVKR